MSGSVIVLTNAMQFWDETTVKRAALKVMKDRAVIIAHNGCKLYTYPDGSILWCPLVIQLTNKNFIGYKYKSDRVFWSDEAVYNRDNNYCQYWHYYKRVAGELVTLSEPYIHRCTEEERTIDHVIPTSRGGQNTFDNTVCSCRYCNEVLKKNRTPSEAGLKLLRYPESPKRNAGDLVIRKFVYNPNKPSHQEYVRLVLNGIWK